MEVILPEELEFIVERVFVEKALSAWGSDLSLSVLKSLVGGRTSASVLLVEIRSPSKQGLPSSDSSLSGQFILKLDEKKVWETAEPNERERHEAAIKWNLGFANQHIPKLVRNYEDDQRVALLYELAGFKSRVNLVTIEGLDAGSLERHCHQLSLSLFRDWNQNYRVETNIPPHTLLQEWLGYRLEPTLAPKLHTFVKEQTGGQATFILGKRVLINPMWLCGSECIREQFGKTRFAGLLHGDLHSGNILFDRRYPESELFWLIDFALSREGSLGYDHSYLELSLLLRELVGKDPERLLGILDALDAPIGSSEATTVPPEHLGMTICLRAIRTASEKWQQQFEPNSPDSFVAQQLLARVAVSLNWINKPIEDSQKRLALAYGAWAADKYLADFHNSSWESLLRRAEVPQNPLQATEVLQSSNPTLLHSVWQDFWETLDGFDESLCKFVLVSDRLNCSQEVASVGFLPWSAIIDLDPESDASGLHFHAAPILEKLRSVSWFGIDAQPVNFDRGTAWMMAGGWPTRGETPPGSLNNWRRTYLGRVRELCSAVHRASSPQPVKVVVFLNDPATIELLQRLLEGMDEKLLDEGKFIIVSQAALTGTGVRADKSFNISPSEIVTQLNKLYGANEEAKEPQIPGIDGPVSIKIDRLRNLEEDLALLHTNILGESLGDEHAQDDFWKGNPPTWVDLHAEVDIRRDIQQNLVKELSGLLRESRNSILELYHAPGAGGTTVALRAAWTMRNSAPTVILRRYSKLTADRIDELFHLAQLPVLVIADASELPPSVKDDLYRDLSKRNSRAVILYVIRTMHVNAEEEFTIPEAMDKSEAEKFYRAYSARTKDPQRVESLKKITYWKGQWETYRSPFFYGLTIYERDFVSLDRYVESHIANISPLTRDVVLYFALVTRYSQVGVSEALVKKLLNIRPEAAVNIVEAVGHGPGRLIIKRSGEFKLSHPLIAEEVLRQLMGGGDSESWSHGLKDLSVKFIREIAALAGAETDEVQRLLFQLFILRDEWSEEKAHRRQFSTLIEAIQSDAGQYEVLQLLTTVCPKEPHYWNHLGRHHIYKARQNFEEAEKYLERAVELSEGKDALHHHALGMVRRFWISDEIKRLFAEPRSPSEPVSADEILSRVAPLAAAAFYNFTKARDISAEDTYGYITHIQTFLQIAESLRQAAGKKTIHDLLTGSGQVGEWFRQHLFVAEELLERVKHLRGQRKVSDHEVECLTRLSALYGRFDDLIFKWESLLDKSRESGYVRRTLATVYFAKRDRDWSNVPAGELRRIAELMESNLSYDPTNEHDLRMWFQAHRRLPEFNYFSAIDRLDAWASREGALDAHYYLYILHFLRWREGGERDEDSIMKHLQKCISLRVGQRGFSYEWLGKGPKWCPLVHSSELGGWDAQERRFSDVRRLLFY